MKFQKLEALEKHVKEAFPKHLGAIYLILCPNEGERKRIFLSLFQIFEKICDIRKFIAIKEALFHINGASLFSDRVAALFDGVDVLTEEEIKLLTQYMQAPNPAGYLILGAASSKYIADLYKVGKKEIVILDLSKEKPWEEKQRLQKWVIQTLNRKKKEISSGALETFLKRLPHDRFLLEQELEKLLCYLGNRDTIAQCDIEAICSSSEEVNLFALARELAWGKTIRLPEIADLSFLLSLVSQLRSQLEMGLKIAALLKKEAPIDEIASAFPKLWPKALEEIIQYVREKKGKYFKNVLLALYDLEFGLKTSSAKPEILFARYCGSTLL